MEVTAISSGSECSRVILSKSIRQAAKESMLRCEHTSIIFASEKTASFPIPFLPNTFRPPGDKGYFSRLSCPMLRKRSLISSADIPMPSSCTMIVGSFPVLRVIHTFCASASYAFCTSSEIILAVSPYSCAPRSFNTFLSILIR